MNQFLLVAIAALALVFGLAACGGDDESDETASLERYCELSAELDELGQDEFAALSDDPDATDEDFENLQSDLITDNEEIFEEVREIAPDEISDEVETLVSATLARADLSDEEFTEGQINDAEQAVLAFEEDNCEDGEAVTTTYTETDETTTDATDETTTTETDETTTETTTEETTTTDDSGETTTEDDATGGVSPE